MRIKVSKQLRKMEKLTPIMMVKVVSQADMARNFKYLKGLLPFIRGMSRLKPRVKIPEMTSMEVMFCKIKGNRSISLPEEKSRRKNTMAKKTPVIIFANKKIRAYNANQPKSFKYLISRLLLFY